MHREYESLWTSIPIVRINGGVTHDVTSLLHAGMHTVVFTMITVLLNPRFCKFWGHSHSVYWIEIIL